MNTRRWLARFSFSFFIFALLLAREIYLIHAGQRASVPMWRLGAYFVALLLSLVLGGLGVRWRHAQIRRDE